MNLATFNTFCESLPQVFHVVQWGGAHVWKVGGAAGKMFAIAWDRGEEGVHITFKVSPMSYDLLKDREGLRPAPYLASRGMTWIQRTTDAAMDDGALRDYLKESWRLCALALPKRRQMELGFL